MFVDVSKTNTVFLICHVKFHRGSCGCDRMVVGFTTIYAIGGYHSITINVVSSNPAQEWYITVDTSLNDKICQQLMASRWFPPPIKLTAMM